MPRPAVVPVTPKPKPAVAPNKAKEAELRQLQKQKEELRKKQLEHQQRILTVLSGMKGKSKEKDELMAQLAALTAQMSESMQKEKSNLEATKKKAAAAAAAVPAQLQARLGSYRRLARNAPAGRALGSSL